MNNAYKNLNVKNLFLFVLNIFFTVCFCISNENNFDLKDCKPTLLKQNGAEIFQYWEFNNTNSLWETNFNTPSYIKSYRDTLEMLLGIDSCKFIIRKVAFQDSSYVPIKSENGDFINEQLVHSNILGRIRQINKLEAQLLDYQLSRYPLISKPTEFHGFIMLNDSLNQVKVYFAASDKPWPPKPGVILEKIIYDLKSGWTLKYHLHNHYEPKSNNYIGILAPSMTDAQYYSFLSEEYKLFNALITNGFFTVEINNKEFSKFKYNE